MRFFQAQAKIIADFVFYDGVVVYVDDLRDEAIGWDLQQQPRQQRIETIDNRDRNCDNDGPLFLYAVSCQPLGIYLHSAHMPTVIHGTRRLYVAFDESQFVCGTCLSIKTTNIHY